MGLRWVEIVAWRGTLPYVRRETGSDVARLFGGSRASIKRSTSTRSADVLEGGADGLAGMRA